MLVGVARVCGEKTVLLKLSLVGRVGRCGDRCRVWDRGVLFQ